MTSRDLDRLRILVEENGLGTHPTELNVQAQVERAKGKEAVKQALVRVGFANDFIRQSKTDDGVFSFQECQQAELLLKQAAEAFKEACGILRASDSTKTL